MSRDIKTRISQKGTIKTLKRSVKTFDNSIRSGGNLIKDSTQQVAAASDPSSGSADMIQGFETRAAGFAGRKTAGGASRLVRGSLREAIHVKQRTAAAKDSIKAARQSIKTAKQTAKAGIKQVKGSIKTARASIKAAKATIKTAKNTAKAAQKAAQASIRATQISIRVAIQAARVTIQAVIAAVKATVQATAALIKGIGALIASGGWIVGVVLVAVILIVIIVCSALGVFSGEETDGKTLQTVQQELNEEFQEELQKQKDSLTGYDEIEVRPAEVITEWNNIVAVYSVRAQNAGFVAAEMSEENISLLRETMWDMVTFSTSSEAVTVPESDEETGSEEESAATVGVVTVNYLTMDEAAQLYDFTEDDQELLVMVLQMSTGGGYIGGSGNGMMINPCPDGTFNGNDYPYYPSGGYHAGRDIACPIGTPVYAAAGGTVIHINDQADTYGNHIMIAHGNEVYTLYAHCSELLVSVGDEVVQGQQIAWSGNTGNTTGPHLHFEVRAGGSQYRVNNVDPLEWIG